MQRFGKPLALALAVAAVGSIAAGAGDQPDRVRGMLALLSEHSTIPARPLQRHLLHAAALNNMSEWALQLIDRGMPVDVRDPKGRTPLMVAAAFNSMEVAEALIARGADPHMAETASRNRPVHFAAAAGHVGMVEMLRLHGADLNARADIGRTPLHYAAYYGHRKMIAHLIANGVDPDVTDDMGIRPLQYASRRLQGLTVDLLIELGARPDDLFDAVNAGDVARVQELLAHGADVNALDMFGTPLHRAAVTGQVYIASMLIDAGADLEATADPEGFRPLHVAALNHQSAIARLLLDRGALVDSRDSVGRTPLGIAANYESVGVAAELLARGADPTAKDASYGDTPIHYAASRDSIGMVDLLLGAGVDVNLRSPHDGRTPIGKAAEKGNGRVIEYLLHHGADPNLRDDHGQTPLQIASSRARATGSAAAVLRRLGAL